MNELETKALLPAGLRDVLAPEAAAEAALVERLMAVFASHGYVRIKPPLVEFEEGLLSGPGSAVAAETFRLMDPISQRMMGIRSDITPQVARIAATRLVNQARPLRLSYAGEVLRVKGTQLRPERQLTQAGVELIGSEALPADAEVIVMAAEALAAVGVGALSIDLSLPTLVPGLCDDLGIEGAGRRRLREALDLKDGAAVKALAIPGAALFCKLIESVGRVEAALPALDRLDLPPRAAAERQRLRALVERIREADATLPLTLDLVEHRGLEYHAGVSFAVFSPGVWGELGSGGRYRTAGFGGAGATAGEPATGLTLYVDTVLKVMEQVPTSRRVLLAAGTSPEDARRLRAEGWQTVADLGDGGGPSDEQAGGQAVRARLQGCGHVFSGGEIRPVER